HQHLVETLAGGGVARAREDHPPVVESVAPDERGRQRDRARPGHAHDPHAAGAGRCRDRRDRVVVPHTFSGAGTMRRRRTTPSPSLRVVPPGTLSGVMWMIRRSCGLIGFIVIVVRVRTAFSPSRLAMSPSVASRRARYPSESTTMG